MQLEEVFSGTNGAAGIDKILMLTKRVQEIDSAISTIKYDNELFTEIPEVVKKLAAAKTAAIAELKTL